MDEQSSSSQYSTSPGSLSETDNLASDNELPDHNSSQSSPPTKREVNIQQFVHNVVDFSSQYGSDYSISYTAFNITGKPCKYPDYGDFPETYAMRTYGDWWDKTPSSTEEIMPQNFNSIPTHDFIVVEFEEFVYPREISIYETYNPGAIVKIWAYTITEKWVLLWSDLPDALPKGRLFKPPILKILQPTKVIRLEFNHSKLNYFTEIDAILLEGPKYHCKPSLYRTQSLTNLNKGRIMRKLEKEKFELQFFENHDDVFKNFMEHGLKQFMEEAGLAEEEECERKRTTIKNLPNEILHKIFKYLDLVSIFRAAQVCRKLYDAATDPLLYSEISLKPYWHCASSDLLETLSRRATHLRKLDLSWCGLFNSIRPIDFKNLISLCGENLTHLRLNSCSFLTNCCIDMIGSKCPNLRELSLRNFKGDSNFLWGLVSLRHLERLDLYRSVSEPDVLYSILKNNPNLRHLDLGLCGLPVDMDQVALFIGKYNKQMVSIDMWKSHSLTAKGINALAECHNLEEVDFGWCMREEASPGESLRLLVKSCPKLKKICLAAIRGFTDRDLEYIASYCPDLEQLDLMGMVGITTEMCYKLLSNCKKLKLIDLSFCDQLDDLQVNLPNITIKRLPEQKEKEFLYFLNFFTT